MKKTIIASALALLGHGALAADYYVVLPVKGKTLSTSNISVSLGASSLPNAQVGIGYTYDFKPHLQVTGDPSYTGYGVSWSAVSALPAGLTLDSKTGVLSGVPSASGTYAITLKATYMTRSGEQSYQLMVANIQVALASGAPPQAIVGQAYAYNLKPLLSVSGDGAYDGTGVTWSVVSSSLPTGLYLTSDGFIGGTPTAAGTGSITVRATYKNIKGEQAYQVETLNIQVAIAASTPTQATVGQAYAYDLAPLVSVTGDAQYTATNLQLSLEGALPAGLSFSSGKVTGTPTAAETKQVIFKASYRNVQASRALTFSAIGSLGITQYSGYRAWADGSYAASCNGYRNPTDGHTYSGSTGNGAYRIQPLTGPVMDVYCDMTTAGGGWTLVRRAPPGAWHQTTDNAAGTNAAYGTYSTNPRTTGRFSLQYGSGMFNFTDMLFMTGDGVKWVAAPKSSVSTITGSCSIKVPVLASHLSASAYSVAWCLRSTTAEDPWISAADHSSGTDSDTHSMVYGEANYNGWRYWLDNRDGGNVYIR